MLGSQERRGRRRARVGRRWKGRGGGGGGAARVGWVERGWEEEAAENLFNGGRLCWSRKQEGSVSGELTCGPGLRDYEGAGETELFAFGSSH